MADENRMITFEYANANYDTFKKQTIPNTKECMTKADILNYINVDESLLSSYTTDKLIKRVEVVGKGFLQNYYFNYISDIIFDPSDNNNLIAVGNFKVPNGNNTSTMGILRMTLNGTINTGNYGNLPFDKFSRILRYQGTPQNPVNKLLVVSNSKAYIINSDATIYVDNTFGSVNEGVIINYFDYGIISIPNSTFSYANAKSLMLYQGQNNVTIDTMYKEQHESIDKVIPLSDGSIYALGYWSTFYHNSNYRVMRYSAAVNGNSYTFTPLMIAPPFNNYSSGQLPYLDRYPYFIETNSYNNTEILYFAENTDFSTYGRGFQLTVHPSNHSLNSFDVNNALTNMLNTHTVVLQQSYSNYNALLVKNNSTNQLKIFYKFNYFNVPSNITNPSFFKVINRYINNGTTNQVYCFISNSGTYNEITQNNPLDGQSALILLETIQL